MFYRLRPLFFILMTLLGLYGCGEKTTRPTIVTEPDPSLIKVDPDIALAKRFNEEGQYEKASILYQRLANRFGSPARQRYLFYASENALLGQHPKMAQQILVKLLSTPLSKEQQARFNILNAQSSFDMNQPELAMNSLLEVRLTSKVTTALRKRYHRLSAKIYQALDNYAETAHQLEQLDLLLSPSEQKLNNQQHIIDALNQIPQGQLTQLNTEPESIEKGWIELAQILSNNRRQQSQLNQWYQKYPSHPVMHELIDNQVATNESVFVEGMEIQQIGVLLPLSGRYSKIAKVIQNGIMTAVFSLEASQRPIVHFYDTSNPQDAWPLYSEAVSAGDNWIIGPLNKEAVSLLAHAGNLPAPVIALNRIELDITPPPNFFQFGLVPEDEAAEAALKISNSQLTQPLLLTPNNQWGERMRLAFEQQWQNMGGQIAGQQVYDPKTKDFSSIIKQILNLNDSEKRKRQIERILGKRVSFIPHRRSDADALFIATKNPSAARLIRPQIQFHHAFDLPVYANSSVWNGIQNKRQDIDLESVLFPYPAILLKAKSEEMGALDSIELALSRVPKKRAPLFLMGVDSLNLLYQIPRLQSNPNESYEGLTGILTLDNINRLHRQPMWGQFKQGLVIPIGYRLPNSSDNIQDAFETSSRY